MSDRIQSVKVGLLRKCRLAQESDGVEGKDLGILHTEPAPSFSMSLEYPVKVDRSEGIKVKSELTRRPVQGPLSISPPVLEHWRVVVCALFSLPCPPALTDLVP